ncbi:hypothetical protein Taro_027929, partial [Colocasia esculenta]|nr:hypothetical protein [Colocasia esculenta]
PFLGASPWWHWRVWLPDLTVCLGSGVVLLVGPRPCGGVPRLVSVLCLTLLVSAGVVCVLRPWLVVVALHYSVPLLSSTLL